MRLILHIANILNYYLLNKRFPETVKIANVRPIYKKDSREKLENYRPVLILTALSKIYDIFKSIDPHVENYLSIYVSAFRTKIWFKSCFVKTNRAMNTTLKASVFGVFLVHIFPHLD